jgi:hypothetical protein
MAQPASVRTYEVLELAGFDIGRPNRHMDFDGAETRGASKG